MTNSATRSPEQGASLDRISHTESTADVEPFAGMAGATSDVSGSRRPLAQALQLRARSPTAWSSIAVQDGMQTPNVAQMRRVSSTE